MASDPLRTVFKANATVATAWMVVACAGSSEAPAQDAGSSETSAQDTCRTMALPTCTVTSPDASDCKARAFFADTVCGVDALPDGLSCFAAVDVPCGLLIDPSPDWQKYPNSVCVELYVCSCVDGGLSCSPCAPDAGCTEVPDGAN